MTENGASEHPTTKGFKLALISHVYFKCNANRTFRTGCANFHLPPLEYVLPVSSSVIIGICTYGEQYRISGRMFSNG